MGGSDNTSRAGRLAALATLAVSAALFVTALFGIASIDPNADAAAPVPKPTPASSVALDDHPGHAATTPDCPWRDGARRGRGVAS